MSDTIPLFRWRLKCIVASFNNSNASRVTVIGPDVINGAAPALDGRPVAAQ